MRILISLFMLFGSYQVRASDEKTTYSCSQGDAYISLQVSTNRHTLKAGICNYSSCSNDLSLTGELNSVDSEGYRKSYEIAGPDNDQFVLFFDANGDVMEVQQFLDNVLIQRFDGCTHN